MTCLSLLEGSCGKLVGEPSNTLPENVENPNEEAVALDSIKFVQDVAGAKENLKVIDQAIILGLCLNVKNTNPKCGLVSEEMSGMGLHLERRKWVLRVMIQVQS